MCHLDYASMILCIWIHTHHVSFTVEASSWVTVVNLQPGSHHPFLLNRQTDGSVRQLLVHSLSLIISLRLVCLGKNLCSQQLFRKNLPPEALHDLLAALHSAYVWWCLGFRAQNWKHNKGFYFLLLTITIFVSRRTLTAHGWQLFFFSFWPCSTVGESA